MFLILPSLVARGRRRRPSQGSFLQLLTVLHSITLSHITGKFERDHYLAFNGFKILPDCVQIRWWSADEVAC